MSQKIERLVRNQILFREVNERVRETIGAFEGPVEFLCECSRPDCVETIPLDVDEYERIRSVSNLFLVASGHELLKVDRVVDQGKDYLLVEKTVGIEEVRLTDPRSGGA